MSRWFADNSQAIGRTPLVRVNRVTDGAGATVFAKIEGRNPAKSVKRRIGAAMIRDVEAKRLLGAGVVIGEATVIGRNVRLYQGVTLGANRFETEETGAWAEPRPDSDDPLRPPSPPEKTLL